MSTVSVRYIVSDVSAAIAFYVNNLGFTERTHPDPAFAMLTLGAVMQAAIVEEDPLYKLTTEGDLEEELIRLVFRYLGIKE